MCVNGALVTRKKGFYHGLPPKRIFLTYTRSPRSSCQWRVQVLTTFELLSAGSLDVGRSFFYQKTRKNSHFRPW